MSVTALTSDSGIAAATLGQDFTEQVLAATASVVAMVTVAPFHAVEPWAKVGMARHFLCLHFFSQSLLVSLSHPHANRGLLLKV